MIIHKDYMTADLVAGHQGVAAIFFDFFEYNIFIQPNIIDNNIPFQCYGRKIVASAHTIDQVQTSQNVKSDLGSILFACIALSVR